MAKKKIQAVRLEYGDNEKASLEACRVFLEEAIGFLTGKRKALPSLRIICTAGFPGSSILRARCDGEIRSDTGWPFVACLIADQDAKNERYFDPCFFVAMRLFELPGGRFRFDRSKRNQYFYLAYAGPEGSEGNHYLRRIIANTPWWSDTREDKSDGSHYNYQRVALKRTAKAVVRSLGQETRSASRVRDDAIKFAVDLFRRQLRGRSKIKSLNLSAREYESLLRFALDVADAVYEKLLLQRAGRE